MGVRQAGFNRVGFRRAGAGGGGGGGTVTAVTGTPPIASSGGATPAISITNATDIADGSMSAADKTKLDGITAGAAVASVSGTAPIASSGGTTPAISISAASGGGAGSMSASNFTKLSTLSLWQILVWNNGTGAATNRWLTPDNAGGSATTERSWPVPQTSTNIRISAWASTNSLDGATIINVVKHGGANIVGVNIGAGATGFFSNSAASTLTGPATDAVGIREDMTASTTGSLVVFVIVQGF